MSIEAVERTATAALLGAASPSAVASGKEAGPATLATATATETATATTTGLVSGDGGSDARNGARLRRPLHPGPSRPPRPSYPLGGHGSERGNNNIDDDNVVIPDTCPEAYVLEWGPHTPCTRTPLDVDGAFAAAEEAATVAAASAIEEIERMRADAIRRMWQCDQDIPTPASPSSPATKPSPSRALATSHKLFVLRDTGNKDTNNAISRALGIDPEFMAAHAADRRYRPQDRPWRGPRSTRTTFFASSYMYPQVLTLLVCRSRVSSPVDFEKQAQMDETPGYARPSRASTGEAMFKGSVRGRQDAPVPVTVSSSPSAKLKSPVSEPSSWPSPEKDDTSNCRAAMLCRASLWTSSRANVLLLDRSPSSTTLEDALLDALDDTTMPDTVGDLESGGSGRLVALADTLHDVVVRLAYDQWLDLFDTIGSSGRQAYRNNANKKLYWDMAQVLEQNLFACREQEKTLYQMQRGHSENLANRTGDVQVSPIDPVNKMLDSIAPEDWKHLLARLERMVALLPLQKRKPAAAVTPRGKVLTRFSTPGTTFTVNRFASGDIDGLTTRDPDATGLDSAGSHLPAAGGVVGTPPPPFETTPEGKSALSRVTYMGGILLPFSIIAGILSMSDPYGPGDRLFWVFWAITIPITFFTLIIIYADEIRNIYVWQPLSHDNLQKAIKKGEAIPAAAAAALANAAETVIDKLSSDLDSDIETEPVTAAVRLGESRRGGRHHRARVRVATNSGPNGPTYYRLSEPAEVEARPSIAIPGLSPLVSLDKANQTIKTEIMNARRRRKFHIPNPWQLIRSAKRSHPDNAGLPVFQDPEQKSGTYNEAVIIDINQPNENAGLAEAIGMPVASPNIGAPGCPAIIMQHRPGGLEPTAWRRQQLGWGGAIKSIVGYQKPQAA